LHGEVYRGKEFEKFKELQEFKEGAAGKRHARERLFLMIVMIRAPYKSRLSHPVRSVAESLLAKPWLGLQDS
jgi:hypothetical protein